MLMLQWRQNERDGVSNHQRRDCLLNRLFRRRSKKTSKLCVIGLCEGNSPMTSELPVQRASYAEMFPFDVVVMKMPERILWQGLNFLNIVHNGSVIHWQKITEIVIKILFYKLRLSTVVKNIGLNMLFYTRHGFFITIFNWLFFLFV